MNIHTIVQQHCAGCHVPNNATEGLPQQPYFAVSTRQDSYDVSRGVPLINLTVPEQSRFYTRLATDGHRCWDAGSGVSCADSAAAMLSAINHFINNGISAPDTTELNTMITSRAVSLFEDGIAASGGNPLRGQPDRPVRIQARFWRYHHRPQRHLAGHQPDLEWQ